ncbi:hypothetical protein Btru_014043 [Bulinus truncatus]|nr:hypothetical protein Btru_014043 [Bulinus truncatus]
MKAKGNEVSPVMDFNKPGVEDQPDYDKSSARDVFSNYADIASLNGVAFIKTSKHPVVKVIWAVLLTAAIGAMIYHLYTLFDKYFKYDKHSEITTGFSSLTFPAVTICNVNILRASQLGNASQEIQDLVSKLDPVRLQALAQNFVQDSQAFAEYDYDSNYSYNALASDFFDEVDLNITSSRNTAEDQYYDQADPSSWGAVGNTSSFSEAEDAFQDLYTQMGLRKQKSLGHQVNDLIQQCSFTRKACPKRYDQITTSSYGNCYTVSNEKFISSKSGPDGGLEFILYLELDEYIPGITSGRGAQVIIHERGSVPFPEEEGIAIPAGQQTVITLKQIKINRLGDPYSPCRAIDDYTNLYNVTYTRNICQRICILNNITEECKCFDERFQYINRIMKLPPSLQPCRDMTELKCMVKVARRFKDLEGNCNCLDPCSENTFEKTISSRQWPNPSMAQLLVENVCQIKPEACVGASSLRSKTGQDLQENFLKLNVYFQDLNYEEMSEQPNYELTQLLSDIGGTIGLWIGGDGWSCGNAPDCRPEGTWFDLRDFTHLRPSEQLFIIFCNVPSPMNCHRINVF